MSTLQQNLCDLQNLLSAQNVLKQIEEQCKMHTKEMEDALKEDSLKNGQELSSLLDTFESATIDCLFDDFKHEFLKDKTILANDESFYMTFMKCLEKYIPDNE